MISTRTKKQDKDKQNNKEAIVIGSNGQKKLWEKYFSTDNPMIKFECLSSSTISH